MKHLFKNSFFSDSSPKLILDLILLTSIVSISAGLLEIFFQNFLGLNGPITYLSLSWEGLSHYFFWQPLTYFFIYGIDSSGIDFYWMIGLSINMYILWTMGTNLCEHFGAKSFLKMYLLTGVLAGLLAVIFTPLLNSLLVLTGQTAIILAIITSWAMLNPDSYVFLFFVFPIKTRWLLATILGVLFLNNLSNFNLPILIYYFSGVAIGYLYSAIVWNLRSPYAFTHKFDDWLNNLGYSNFFSFFRRKSSTKVFDIRTGEHIEKEEQFMNRMLDKISKNGKDSLTWFEKFKMNRISKKRKKKV